MNGTNKKQWTAEDVIAIQNLISTLNIQSLDEPVRNDSGEVLSELGDFVKDNGPDPQELSEENELREFLLKCVSELSARQQLVIEKRFGLTDGKPKTLEETGKLFNVTRERIRQIEQRALKQLRWLLVTKYKYNEFKGDE